MSIWFDKELSVEKLKPLNKNTMNEHLGIEWTEVTSNSLKAKMPVDHRTLPMFTADQRLQWISDIYRDEERVEGAVYEGLTINFCKKMGAQFILRGIRYVSDFEYEKTIADANRTLDKTIETIFLTGEPKYTSVASTIVRDIIRNGGNAAPFLPEIVSASLNK